MLNLKELDFSMPPLMQIYKYKQRIEQFMWLKRKSLIKKR